MKAGIFCSFFCAAVVRVDITGSGEVITASTSEDASVGLEGTSVTPPKGKFHLEAVLFKAGPKYVGIGQDPYLNLVDESEAVTFEIVDPQANNMLMQGSREKFYTLASEEGRYLNVMNIEGIDKEQHEDAGDELTAMFGESWLRWGRTERTKYGLDTYPNVQTAILVDPTKLLNAAIAHKEVLLGDSIDNSEILAVFEGVEKGDDVRPQLMQMFAMLNGKSEVETSAHVNQQLMSYQWRYLFGLESAVVQDKKKLSSATMKRQFYLDDVGNSNVKIMFSFAQGQQCPTKPPTKPYLLTAFADGDPYAQHMGCPTGSEITLTRSQYSAQYCVYQA